MEDGMVNSVQV